LKKDSINWELLERTSGDLPPQRFSIRTPLEEFPYLPQVSCFITYTDREVHKILEKGFDRSPMFTGVIHGVVPILSLNRRQDKIVSPIRKGINCFLSRKGWIVI